MCVISRFSSRPCFLCGDTLASILPSRYSRYGCSSISGKRRNSSSVIVLATRTGRAIVDPPTLANRPIRPGPATGIPGRSTRTGQESVVPDLRWADNAERHSSSVLQSTREVEVKRSFDPRARGSAAPAGPGRTAQAEYERHHPEVLVGSSWGGAVAMNLNSGSTPWGLACPAWRWWDRARTRQAGDDHILHAEADDMIPMAESRLLVRERQRPARVGPHRPGHRSPARRP